MSAFSLKTVLRKTIGFLNVGKLLKKRAESRKNRDRTFFIFDGTYFTYADVYKESVRYANLFHAVKKKKVAEGRLNPDESMAVGVYQENTPEFIFSFFGAALSNAALFGINTGFRGDTLKNVILQSDPALIFTDQTNKTELDRILPELHGLGEDEIITVGPITENKSPKSHGFEEALERLCDKPEASLRLKIDSFHPFVVIYTSGTTGAPKGVVCSQIKCLGAGIITMRRIGLTQDDRGYIAMPLFHSNAVLLGIMPMLVSGGSFLLKRRFSASAFEQDILEHGVTYMNYVGQPIHYILVALEKKYGNQQAIEKSLAVHPANRFRIAHGNGAAPVDREKLIRYCNMEHVYELYGSTEAPITTVLMPGDPVDSVGQVPSNKIVVLNDNDGVCPPGVVDANGQLLNYDEAVGEIARKLGAENIFFDGYYKNNEATDKKYRKGYYCSGDLGHIRMVNGKRCLYFNGRTDDWIRKDGENFSAENVVQYAGSIPGVELATGYGAPCEVSDEKVMVSLKMHSGVDLHPEETFDWFMKKQKEGGMDPKWMPDYIRIVEDFPMTSTHKVLIRSLKRENFNIEQNPSMNIYFRQRGDKTYRPLTAEAFKEIKGAFEENGRLSLLDY